MAATIIDELVTVLKLDPTQFNSEQKRFVENLSKTRSEAQRTAKELEQQGKRAAEFYSNIKKEALGLFAVVVGQGSIDSYIKTQVSNLTNLSVAAKNAGVSFQSLSAAMQLARINNDDPNAAASSLTSIASVLTAARTGKGMPTEFARAFGTIGGNQNDVLDPLDYVQMLARFKDNKNLHPEYTGARLDGYVSQIGRDLGLSPGLIFEAQKGEKAFMADRAAAMKNAPSQQALDAATDLKNSFATLSSTIVHGINEDFIGLDKALKPILGGLNKLAEEHPKWVGAIAGIGAGIVALSTTITALKLILSPLIGLFGGLGKVLSRIVPASLIPAEVASVGALVAAELTSGAALVALPFLIHPDGEDAYGRFVHGEKLSLEEMKSARQFAVNQYKSTAGPAGKVIRDRYMSAIDSLNGQIMAASKGSGSSGSIPGGNGNNPGNLTDGRGNFLSFSTPEEGFAAMVRQIQIDYRKHGQHTIRDLINSPTHGYANEWARGNSHASSKNYIDSVSNALGISADADFGKISASKIARAMAAFEQGHGSGGRGSPGGIGQVGPIYITVPPGADARTQAEALRKAIIQANLANRGLS